VSSDASAQRAVASRKDSRRDANATPQASLPTGKTLRRLRKSGAVAHVFDAHASRVDCRSHRGTAPISASGEGSNLPWDPLSRHLKDGEADRTGPDRVVQK
jgi:hypothetical protein